MLDAFPNGSRSPRLVASPLLQPYTLACLTGCCVMVVCRFGSFPSSCGFCVCPPGDFSRIDAVIFAHALDSALSSWIALRSFLRLRLSLFRDPPGAAHCWLCFRLCASRCALRWCARCLGLPGPLSLGAFFSHVFLRSLLPLLVACWTLWFLDLRCRRPAFISIAPPDISSFLVICAVHRRSPATHVGLFVPGPAARAPYGLYGFLGCCHSLPGCTLFAFFHLTAPGFPTLGDPALWLPPPVPPRFALLRRSLSTLPPTYFHSHPPAVFFFWLLCRCFRLRFSGSALRQVRWRLGPFAYVSFSLLPLLLPPLRCGNRFSSRVSPATPAPFTDIGFSGVPAPSFRFPRAFVLESLCCRSCSCLPLAALF